MVVGVLMFAWVFGAMTRHAEVHQWETGRGRYLERTSTGVVLECRETLMGAVTHCTEPETWQQIDPLSLPPADYRKETN